MLTSDVNGLRVRVPRSFEGILPVSPSAKPFSYEIETYRGMRRALLPGMLCFDIGSNFGGTACEVPMASPVRGHLLASHPMRDK